MALPSVSWVLLSCLLLLSQAQGEESKKELHSPRGACPEGSYSYRFNCYALFMTPKSWADADIACQKRPSGFLASVLSPSEASFLASVVKSNSNSCPDVWMGLHDPTQGYEPNAGGWEWSNNDVMNYVAWERNPATNSGYCGSLSRSAGYLKWKNNNCAQKLPYICKFKKQKLIRSGGSQRPEFGM
ncbi:regenerating islet-derived protein 3-gamma isoform X1 [Pipistrellus kuhlii]|uniref:regenerating islet-derived protein 3-gamma isoform X1 n=1 Tax=Pipistrellus kuhlii TaxID=59472 RepID=UPI001E27106B|nr:regenerating islet-derived protein 3-gamma isoform X1 [Pipistrellus kuhlii]